MKNNFTCLKNYFTIAFICCSFLANAQSFTEFGSKLIGNGSVGNANQGSAVSLSSDGKIAIIGGSADDSWKGAAWVYTFNGANFVQLGNKLVGTGEPSAYQGFAVSISGDGKTALVGGPYGNSSNTGAAWVYTFDGSNFAQVGNKLIGTGGVGNVLQGKSVSLSGDGKIALVGGTDDDNGVGAVWVYTFDGANFVQAGSKLVGTGGIASSQQGTSVSISSDGKTALVGGQNDNVGIGAVWVFTHTGSNFVQVGNKLVGTGPIGKAYQGSSVSLSADGKTALVGGPTDNTDQGAAWVYTFTGTNFVQVGNKIQPTGAATGEVYFGTSVSLSADGKTALIGGYKDNSGLGAAWVFTFDGANFVQAGAKIVGTGASGTANLGYAVSLSGDAKTALVGGWKYNSDQGAVWTFKNASAPVTTNTDQIETPQLSQFKIYPNPFLQSLALDMEQETNYILFNIHGMEVEKGQTSSPSIASQLPAGVYQLKVNRNMYKVIKQGN